MQLPTSLLSPYNLALKISDDSPRIIHIQGSKFRILGLEKEGLKEVFSIDANKECLSELEEVSASIRREKRATNPNPAERYFPNLLEKIYLVNDLEGSVDS